MRKLWTEEEDEKLKECREQGMSYKEIAEKVLPHRTIDSCKFRGKKYSDGTSDGRFTTKPENVFKEEFESKFQNFKYVDGYTNTDEYFNLECRRCGLSMKRNACCLRKSKVITCKRCSAKGRIAREANSRKAEEVRRKEAKMKKKLIRKEVEGIRSIANKHRYYLECKGCSRNFFAPFDKKYCSVQCGRRTHNRNRRIRRDERLRDNGRIDWNISIEGIIARDGDACYLCGEECDLNDYVVRNDGTHISGNLYPSIEHVIPVSKGGTHTWDNVLLAHRQCNSMKSDKEVMGEHGQMNIFI